MELWVLIMAAGKGSRLLEATNGTEKQFFQWKNKPLYWQSVIKASRCARIRGLVCVFSSEVKECEKENFDQLALSYDLRLPYEIVAGGELRQDSVRNGLSILPKNCSHVLVHDAARPFVSVQLINRVIDALRVGAKSVVPGIPVVDTIKHVVNEKVEFTPYRENLVAVQTPQGFERNLLVEGHRRALIEHWIVTDDASLIERCGHPVQVVPGDPENKKITTPSDLQMLELQERMIPIVGYGYDVHKYSMEDNEKKPVRAMVLGGVSIPSGPKVLAHSDGDIVLHALMDALLGCASAGDIGMHFPDTDPTYEGIHSAVLLDIVLTKIIEAHISIVHVDITIVAQTPNISPYRNTIRANLARLLSLDQKNINIKATTEEGLGFTGSNKGMKVIAVVTAMRKER